ncbi:hypothetical protein S245_015900, partial [Arachis hypogaea]
NCHSLVILIHRFRTCIYRKKTRRGSSAFMEKEIPFIGILSNKAEQNPELTISFPSRLVCGKMKQYFLKRVAVTRTPLSTYDATLCSTLFTWRGLYSSCHSY